MKSTLPFFNWSLTRLLHTEPDNLKKARISIIFTIIIFSLVKLMIALPVGISNEQNLQVIRETVFLAAFILMLKILLIDSRYAGKVGVVMIWIALSLIWSNAFVTAQAINIATIQIVVTLILSSFYLLHWRWALVYSLLGLLPVIILVVLGDGLQLSRIDKEELASPAYEIIVILNFLTILVVHLLYYQALNRNVLEMETLNNQLQEAVSEANLALQSKADFLSTMSHELRTPLNSVIGITQLLLKSPCSAEQSENLKIVNFSAKNLHLLITDILDFNKLEAKRLKLEAIDVDLYALINDICLGMRFQAEEKGLELEVRIDEAIKSHLVLTDPTRLTQIIHNLLGNAIKFTPSGVVSLDLKVIDRHPDSIKIHFSIADTGIGIDTQQQKMIFDAFTQASSSTTRNFGGTGLGLTIVKRLLKLFESDISVTSTIGKGSEFSFEIQFTNSDEKSEFVSMNGKIEYDLKRLKVLVVEDNPINSLLIKKIFSNWSNDPEFASNGYEALEKFKTGVFDVILMDIHMPLLDGYATTKLIRNLPDNSKSGIPIIALTASVSTDLVLKIREAGMNDYVSKPFNSDDLYKKLKAINITHSDLLAGDICQK